MSQTKQKKMSPSAKAGQISENNQKSAQKKAAEHKKKAIKLVKPPNLTPKNGTGKPQAAPLQKPKQPNAQGGKKQKNGEAAPIYASFGAGALPRAEAHQSGSKKKPQQPQKGGQVKKNNQGKCQVEAWFLTRCIGKKENEK